MTDLVLARGKHVHPEVGLCLLEAAAWLAGEKHTDRPLCVAEDIAHLGRELNDALPDDRRQQLAPLARLMIDTRPPETFTDPGGQVKLHLAARDRIYLFQRPFAAEVAAMLLHAAGDPWINDHKETDDIFEHLHTLPIYGPGFKRAGLSDDLLSLCSIWLMGGWYGQLVRLLEQIPRDEQARLAEKIASRAVEVLRDMIMHARQRAGLEVTP